MVPAGITATVTRKNPDRKLVTTKPNPERHWSVTSMFVSSSLISHINLISFS
jgi:hypothetical protein